MKKTTMPGMPEVEVVEIKTSAPVNVLADPAPAKKPAAKRTRKTAAAKTTAAKTEAKKPAAKRGRKPKAATAAAKKAEGPKKPTALIIMDGFGHREETKGNAIEAAKKPNLDKIFAENPLTYIGASGLDVGLPDGQMGNSEVGHTNIGAGRIVYQELTRITKAIQDGDFFENPALMSAINQCKWFDSTLHIFGLLSDGGVRAARAGTPQGSAQGLLPLLHGRPRHAAAVRYRVYRPPAGQDRRCRGRLHRNRIRPLLRNGS